MLIGGYLGEAGYINATLGFVIGMAGWIYILYEIFSGEAGKAAAKSGNKALVTAFGAMRMIVTVGWAIYPLGYVFGYLTGGVDANTLNVVYNLAACLVQSLTNSFLVELLPTALALSTPIRLSSEAAVMTLSLQTPKSLVLVMDPHLKVDLVATASSSTLMGSQVLLLPQTLITTRFA
jgi:hypothetical protein